MKIIFFSFIFLYNSCASRGPRISSPKHFSEFGNWRGSICTYSKNEGYKSYHNNDEELSDKSIYAIASNSKMFIAAGVLLLEEQDKLKISDPIPKYIPELSVANKKWKKVTIEHLLNHTAGNGEFYDTEFYKKHSFKQKMTFKDIINNLGKINFISSPDAKFSYSNFGYILLGELIKRVSKEKASSFMDRQLFSPARLKYTSLGVENVDDELFVKSYVEENGTLKPYLKWAIINDPHLNETFTDGNMFSTPCDQIKLFKAIDENKIFKTSSAYKKYFSTNKNEYSFGIFKYQKNRHNFISHSGSWIKYRNSFVFNKSLGLYVVFSSNSMDREKFRDFFKKLRNNYLK
jgi:CubicO group peptidase (beta-lactamase class C family)